MSSYKKIQDSPYDPTKVVIHSSFCPEVDPISNSGHNFKETVSFDDKVHFIDEENIVTYVGLILVLLCILKHQQNPDTSTAIGKTLPDPVENPCVFRKTINITVLLVSTITLIYFSKRTNHWTWIHRLLCHATTQLKGALYPLNTLIQQLTNLEQTYVRCSLHCDRWSVKGRDCASILHLFKKVTYRKDE